MSDNLDVVPEESVVDMPSDHEATKAKEAEATEQEEEQPVSLDEPEDEAEEAESEGEEEEEAEQETEEVEMLEFDFGGNKLEIPKGSVPTELSEKIDKFSKDLWSDYTRKSQQNAEITKSLQTRAQALETLQGLNNEALDAFTQGKSIKAELEQLDAINMQALWQSDPDRARQLTDLKAQKSAQLQDIIVKVDRYEAQLAQARQQETARLADEGRQILERKFKGFSTEIAPKLVDYVVKNYGMPKEQAEQWAINPTMTEMALKAMKFDEMQRSTTKTKSTAPKAAPVKAAAKGGKGTVVRDPAKMNMEQYAAWRKQQGA